MNKIFGKYFACEIGETDVFLGKINLSKIKSKPFYCKLKVYGVRPKNIYVDNTAGVVDELTLIEYTLRKTKFICGVVEFRMNAYLYYYFDNADEELIKKNEITKEEYFNINSKK